VHEIRHHLARQSSTSEGDERFAENVELAVSRAVPQIQKNGGGLLAESL
jgi:hypothetical protein